MMLLIGLLLTVLGLVSGGTLLSSSLGMLTISNAVALWILFPLASALGLLIAALGSHAHTVPLLLKLTGAVMLILSLAAVACLVLGSAGMVHIANGTSALWYVFAVGLLIGTANFLAPAAPGQPA